MPQCQCPCWRTILTSSLIIIARESERALWKCTDGRLTIQRLNEEPMAAKYWRRLSYEGELWRQGLSFVAGVDEAGCGPLAGPVVAAAVVFPFSLLETGLPGELRGLNDSKQLTEEQREKYYSVLTSRPELRYAIASSDEEMIDR